jgi:hypothetical protein
MTIDQEMKKVLHIKLLTYEGDDPLLAAVIADMRQTMNQWLRDQKLDPHTWNANQQTLLILQVLCDADVRIA